MKRIAAGCRGRVATVTKLPDLSRFHTISAIAASLDVSERTVRRWIDDGKLKAHRMGGVVRISHDDLHAYIQSSREA